MEKTCLVKRNPELPGKEDNWIIMNAEEFRAFLSTPQGRSRRSSFARMMKCDGDKTAIIAECGEETAKLWNRERSRRRFLAKQMERIKAEFETDDFRAVWTDYGNPIVSLPERSLEEEIQYRMDLEKLGKALRLLEDEQADLIRAQFFSRNGRRTAEKCSCELGISGGSFRYRKKLVLRKLLCMMESSPSDWELPLFSRGTVR